jgi:hypothetical protein
MLFFFTPYSFEKNLFEAIDTYMQLLPDDQDWAVLMDGDTAFLRSDFGHQIQRYIDKYPDTGLFTCYASRCHYQIQTRRGTDMNSDSILYHRQQAESIFRSLDGHVKEIDRRIAGHLMVIKKETWLLIRDEVKRTTMDKNILGVDTKISYAILNHHLKIRLMRGLYIFHYLRLMEGFNATKHLT